MPKHDTTLTPVTLLDKRAYFTEVTAHVGRAKKGDRIALMTMGFEPLEEPVVAKLMDALCTAADQGADVMLVVDAYAFIMDERILPSGPLMRHADETRSKREHFLTNLRVLKKIEEHGGRFAIINRPRRAPSNPFGGRSHIKATIINNAVYVGGCNLDRMATDGMVRMEDKGFADWLYDFVHEVAADGSVRKTLLDTDQTVPIDEATDLLIDSGVSGQSLIMDQTLKMIDDAEEWIVFTCQFFPHGVTAQHLAQALRRGLHVYLFYNHPSKQDAFRKLAHRLVILHERSRWPQELFRRQIAKNQQRLHAKIIATDQGGMIGSHNYVSAGVKLGTAESTLVRRDPGFGLELARFVTRELGIDDIV